LIDFSQKLRELEVTTGGQLAGTLARASQYEFSYARSAPQAVSLLIFSSYLKRTERAATGFNRALRVHRVVAPLDAVYIDCT